MLQALQALQRQPNAAQYFQQLMLQQQINSAQLHNLAAVQQVKHFQLSQVPSQLSQIRLSNMAQNKFAIFEDAQHPLMMFCFYEDLLSQK